MYCCIIVPLVIYFYQGMSLVTGSLDALEVIGRKTVDIISEGDPGKQYISQVHH